MEELAAKLSGERKKERNRDRDRERGERRERERESESESEGWCCFTKIDGEEDDETDVVGGGGCAI